MPRQRGLRGLPGTRADERRPPLRPAVRPLQPPPAPTEKINLSDLDSRNVKTSRGWVQGYNAQAVCTEDQIVIAAEVNIDSPDFGHLEPMVSAARRELERAGVEQPPEVVLADAGYWQHVQMERPVADGMAVLVSPDAKKRGGTRPGWDGGLYAFVRRAVGGVGQPPFGSGRRTAAAEEAVDAAVEFVSAKTSSIIVWRLA